MPRINGQNGEVNTTDTQPEFGPDQPRKTLSVGAMGAAPVAVRKGTPGTGSFSKVVEESRGKEPLLRADSSPLQSPRSVTDALSKAKITSNKQITQDGTELDCDDELVTASAVTRLSFLRGSGQRANVTPQTDPKAQSTAEENTTSAMSPSS